MFFNEKGGLSFIIIRFQHEYVLHEKTTTANKWFQIIKTCENKTMEPLFTQNKNAQLRCLNIFDTDDCLNFNTCQNMYIGCNCTVHITVYASDDNICLK